MRKLITTTFITLDGVMQSVGGPEEDPSGGFKWGGWSANYWDEMMSNIINQIVERPFELLLGRRTYEIFVATWPYVKDDPVADNFNRNKKYVVSHQPMKLAWQNSALITGDAVAEIKKLKAQDGPDLWVHGSGNLIQTLLANHLVDRMYIWTFPVTVGAGKRLFGEGTQPEELKLVESKTSTTGVTITTYEPTGDLKPSSLASENPTEAELERRRRLANER